MKTTIILKTGDHITILGLNTEKVIETIVEKCNSKSGFVEFHIDETEDDVEKHILVFVGQIAAIL